jgi:drug/metabolite transporter (DMT)-like permease
MKKPRSYKWFLLALLSAVIAAPNSAVLKVTVNSVDPNFFNLTRHFMIFLAVLPFLVMNFKKLNKRGLSLSVAAGFFLATATVTYVDAIRLSEASYVSVVTLLTPVVLIIYSAKLVKEKITKKAMAGIMVSAIGATLIVLLPIALKQQGGFDFYPMATFLSLINVFSFPLAVISMRKANEEGVPIASVVAISSFIVAMVCLALFLVEGMPSSTIDGNFWGAVVFSGLVVGLLARSLNSLAYRFIGVATIGALGYLETFIAILISVFALGETLAVSTVLGGFLILAGVYIIEHHKSNCHKFFCALKHH